MHSYRNNCNLPGYGNAKQQCADSNNGILECTWCSNMNGMGCQATVPTTNASCATVSTNNIPENTIINVVNEKGCQCSNAYGACNTAQTQREAGYTKTYPSS